MKNPFDRLPWAAKAFVLTLGAVAIVACEKRLDSAGKVTDSKQVASSSAVLVGTVPAPPTVAEGSPPETTPVNPNQPLKDNPNTWSPADSSKEMSKSEESQSMPMPGQPNDHSNLAADPSQRAGKSDPQTEPPRADTPTSVQTTPK
jgi:hypothetical protein